MKTRIAKAYRNVESFFVDRSSSKPFRFCAVLFALVDMRREALAVVQGRLGSRLDVGDASLTQLRRDVHRIEKGLIMRPRRIPFGRDYLPRLLTRLRKLSADGQIPSEDLEWARNVLVEYFEVSNSCSVKWLEDARRDFRSIPFPTSLSRRASLVPTKHSNLEVSSVSIQSLESLTRQRRSVRWFEDRPVEPEKVDRAVLVGGTAPSACNRQSFRFHMIYGIERAAKVLETVGGTRGFSHQVPAVAVVVGNDSGYRHTFDRHAIFIDGGLASMGFLLALETQGLSACCINWPDVGSRYDALRKLVELAPSEQVLMLIAIGYPRADGGVPSSSKRGIGVLRTQVEDQSSCDMQA